MVSMMHSRSSEEFHRGFHLRMASRMELWVKRAGFVVRNECGVVGGTKAYASNHPHTNAGFSAALVRPT